MKRKGKVAYVPKNVWEELYEIKQNKGIESNAEAFKVMSKYSKQGREGVQLGYNAPLFKKKKKWI